MKLVVEPKRFQQLLENVLLHHQTTELDSNIGKFTTEGVLFEDISLDSVMIVARYKADYFLEYEAEKTEKIAISKSLLAIMKTSFVNDEKIEVYTEDSKIFIKGKTEIYEEPLLDLEDQAMPITFKTDRTMGILPENLEAKVQILVKNDFLSNLPKCEQVFLNIADKEDSAEKEIILLVEGVGNFKKKITPNKTKAIEDLSMKFGIGYLEKIFNQFDGELWLTLRPDASVFSQKNKDYHLTYLLSSSD